MSNIGKNKMRIDPEKLNKISGGTADNSDQLINKNDLDQIVNNDKIENKKIIMSKYGAPPPPPEDLEKPLRKAYGFKGPKK